MKNFLQLCAPQRRTPIAFKMLGRKNTPFNTHLQQTQAQSSAKRIVPSLSQVFVALRSSIGAGVLVIAGCGGGADVSELADAEQRYQNSQVLAETNARGKLTVNPDTALAQDKVSIGDGADPMLQEGVGPYGCEEVVCGANRQELPVSNAFYRNAPTTITPEPPRIERILRQAELANPQCLDDCPFGAKEGAQCSKDCRGKVIQPALPAFRSTTDARVVLPSGGAASVAASRLDGLNQAPLTKRTTALYKNAFSPSRNINLSNAKIPPGVIKRSGSPGRFFCGLDQAPKACGEDDCYDLTLVEPWKAEGDKCPHGWAQCSRMAAVPITVRVKNPKTKDASIVYAHSTGDWVASQAFPGRTAEPLVTADGRLGVFRILGGYPRPSGIGMNYSFVKDDGSVHSGRYSLSYVFSEKPCDVKAWFKTRDDGAYPNMRPWSAAHYDRRLSKYGFAAYPLRDAYGRVFEEGDLVRGSYPWMDRHGNNVIFSTIVPIGVSQGARSADMPVRYPMSIEHAKLGRPTSRSPRGFAVAGSWTHGKIVMLDGVINNEDYGIDVGDTRRFELYRSKDGKPVSVRVDGNSNTRAFPTPGTRGNSQHMESLENTFAMHQGMRAATPRDVVWTISRGDALYELAFDDFSDPHVLLLAEMNAAWKMPPRLADNERFKGTRGGFYEDGFSEQNGRFVHNPAQIALQNAATSPLYPIASPGKIRGNARVEPVAQGGVEGRGLWLEEGVSASFEFPAHQAIPDRAFYLSTFFDSRAPLRDGRRLFAVNTSGGNVYTALHPGGVSVHRTLGDGNEEVISLTLPTDHPYRRNGWHNIGVLFGQEGLVTVFVDGDPIGRKMFSEPVRLGAGARVVLGGGNVRFPGIRGWTDELRLVLAGETSQLEGPASVELLCNYARGTMASLSEKSPLFATAERRRCSQSR